MSNPKENPSSDQPARGQLEPERRTLARARFREKLAALSPSARFKEVVEADDPAELLRVLTAEDLYLIIGEVGLSDAVELVQLASPAQFRALVDLGGWRRDRSDPHRVLTWLRAARGPDRDAFIAKLKALDLELLELLLRRFTRLHDLEETPDVNPEGLTIELPGSTLLVEVVDARPVEESAVRSLLQDLIADDPFAILRLMEAVRWELPSELEEAAYQFRQARLADLGFPDLDEALSLFSRVTIPPPPTAALDGPAAQALEASETLHPWTYLDVCFRTLDASEAELLAGELRQLANAVLVAEGADPGDVEAIKRVAELTRDHLALGFEHLTGGRPQKAAEIVHAHPLRDIFRIGFTLTLQLKYRADRLAKEPLARIDDGWLLFPFEAAAVEALRQRRPRKALRVDGAEPVPFRSLRELAEAEVVLDRAEEQRSILAALLGSEAQAREALQRFGTPLKSLGAERLWAAACARALLGAFPFAAPVEEVRLTELTERLLDEQGALRASAVDAASRALLEGVGPAKDAPSAERWTSLVRETLGALAAELARPYLQGGRVDAKSVALLPVR